MNEETKLLKPAPGLAVFYENPSLGHVPPDGDHVPMTRYYRRLLRDGDLVAPAGPKEARKE